MSDHGSTTPREELFGGAHDAVRAALPALLHGRVTAGERAELDAHLATCASCAAEYRVLTRLRDVYVAEAPPLALDRIAAAVRARTRPGVATSTAAPPAGAVRVPPQRRAPAWARRGAGRAVAATVLLALGSSALFLPRGDRRAPHTAPAGGTAPVHAAAGEAPPIQPPTSAADPSGSLLGASFSDLSDSELAAVVAAVADPAAATPSAEPGSVTPDLTSDAK